MCASDDAVLSDEQCGPLPESLEVCSPEGCQSNYARAVARHYPKGMEEKEEEEKEETPEPEQQPKPKRPTAQPENRRHESESVPKERPCPKPDQNWCSNSYKTFCGNEDFSKKYCCNMCRSMLVG